MTRDLKKEYEQSKKYDFTNINISAKIPKTLNEDFAAKVELEGSTKSAKIKELITNYTYGNKSEK